jgi:hypothetical protein
MAASTILLSLRVAVPAESVCLAPPQAACSCSCLTLQLSRWLRLLQASIELPSRRIAQRTLCTPALNAHSGINEMAL